MNRKKRRLMISKILYFIVLLSFIVPVVFLIYRIFTTQHIEVNDEAYRSKADYVLMLVQCILGIIAMFLPDILSRKLKFKIPSNIYIVYVIFLYCAIFLGEVRNFYHTVPHWDTILHTFSGIMLGAFGFSVISLLNKSYKVVFKMSPIFVSIFAFCFAVTLGVLWEIYEFTFDGLLGLNMQKFALEDGTPLVGRLALIDTMKDLIVDCLGAFSITVIGYISLKYKTGWIKKLLLLNKHSE